jgi:hypothetical protein
MRTLLTVEAKHMGCSPTVQGVIPGCGAPARVEDRPPSMNWIAVVVGVMLVRAYREFEDRVGVTSARRGAKRDMIRDAVTRLPSRFRYADLQRALPAISRPTIARALRELRAEGAVRCVRPGRDATWEKTPG